MDPNKINVKEFYEEFEKHLEMEIEERKKLEEILRANTEAIATLTKSTQDLVEAWESAKGFLNVIAAISKVAKVLAPIGFVVWAIYYFGKTGTWPKL